MPRTTRRGARLAAVAAIVAVTAAACAPTGAPGAGGSAGPVVGGCPVFPSTNAWNTDVSAYPVRANSAQYVGNVNSSGGMYLHPDFGGDGEYGIPFKVVAENEPRRRVRYTAYGAESDPGPFPIPPNAPI